MKYLQLDSNLNASQLVFGCMRISEMSVEALEELVKEALALGVNFFDHADIYGGGDSEKLFGEVLKRNPEMREKMIIQSKCGICRGKHVNYYDCSKKHILETVEQSLERMGIDYLDVLLLHRPDTLMDPKEVAEAFNELYHANKVKYFGVSNMNRVQMEMLQAELDMNIMFNQLQLSPVHSGMVQSGFYVNMKEEPSIDHDGGVLEYCRKKEITIQAWSIMQASWAEGSFIDHVDYPELNNALQMYAEKYGVTKNAIVVAWINRHPANIQPIFGTTSIKHLQEMCAGSDIVLTHEEYYHILASAMKVDLLP